MVEETLLLPAWSICSQQLHNLPRGNTEDYSSSVSPVHCWEPGSRVSTATRKPSVGQPLSHLLYAWTRNFTFLNREKECVVCSDRRSGTRHTTTFYCKTCPDQPTLHPTVCFKRCRKHPPPPPPPAKSDYKICGALGSYSAIYATLNPHKGSKGLLSYLTLRWPFGIATAPSRHNLHSTYTTYQSRGHALFDESRSINDRTATFTSKWLLNGGDILFAIGKASFAVLFRPLTMVSDFSFANAISTQSGKINLAWGHTLDYVIVACKELITLRLRCLWVFLYRLHVNQHITTY